MGPVFHASVRSWHRRCSSIAPAAKTDGAAAALILLALECPRNGGRDYGLSDGYNADVRQTIYDHLRPSV